MRAVAEIHPTQLPVIRKRCVDPNKGGYEMADEVLAELQAGGGAVFALEGQMVDA